MRLLAVLARCVSMIGVYEAQEKNLLLASAAISRQSLASSGRGFGWQTVHC